MPFLPSLPRIAHLADFFVLFSDMLGPLMTYVRTLNALPSRLTAQDAQAVDDAGWSGKALVEMVQINAFFNMMNRIVEGASVNFEYDDAPQRHPSLSSAPKSHRNSYAEFGKRFE